MRKPLAPQFKIRMEPTLKAKAVEMFKAYGLTNQTGVSRLVQFALDVPPDLRAVVLGIVSGRTRDALLVEVVRELKRKKGKG